MAIHWPSVSEPHFPYASFETRWIAASLTSFPPRNDTESVVIARAKPVAIHCEPVSEQTNPSAFLETRWMAASLAFVPPSQ